MKQKIKDPLVSRPDMATELGVTTVTLWRWCKDGKFPKMVRIGGRVGLPRSVLDSWKVEQGWPEPEAVA